MFRESFEAITGHPPFPWQESLFERFLNQDFPGRCDIPTGLGKTSVIAIWLLALAEKLCAGTDLNRYPRRLIYVVNRRTVVDQATEEAKRLRLALSENRELKPIKMALGSLDIDPSRSEQPSSPMPLAISTLRGEFADNAEWRANPARPAVIIGTVDMIGSRLMFAGYGCGFRSSPLHAGFLGQDSLLVHDEAHLEPAFQKLLYQIVDEQKRRCEFRPMRIMELTATSRSDEIKESSLTDADLNDPIVKERLYARKGLEFVHVSNAKAIPDEIAKCALGYRDSGQAILIFLRTLEDLDKVQARLVKEKLAVQTLTGTMRGLERDDLVKENEIFARFMPKPDVVPRQGTVYLISTSAGEVGIDISANHLICDLTPFDSMAQRFGRVNRFGEGDARIHVICEESIKPADDADLYAQRQNTRALLLKLPIRDDGLHDASPGALRALPMDERLSAFTPEPKILPATDILFDSWAMTTIRDLPGRPQVADWLHGIIEEWDPPETRVGWRSEVDEIKTPELREEYSPDDLLEDYPVKSHELLRDRTYRVFKELKELAATYGDKIVWIVRDRGKVIPKSLKDIVEKDQGEVSNCTVLLPPSIGGLSSGMLDGKAKFDGSPEHYDVADQWLDDNRSPRRRRVWDDAPRPEGMRLIRSIDLGIEDEDEVSDEETALPRTWYWFERPRSADNEGSRAAIKCQELNSHLKTAGDFATEIVTKLALREPEASAVILAAKCHDLGKRREKWQRSIRNSRYPDIVLAKSGGRMFPQELSSYRHEFGSLIDLSNDISHQKQPDPLGEDEHDLVMHLVAAHHGRARPHFPQDETFDPERAQTIAAEIACEVPRRFARMQRKYGRWGLAYLESLVRAADILASQAKDGAIL